MYSACLMNNYDYYNYSLKDIIITFLYVRTILF